MDETSGGLIHPPSPETHRGELGEGRSQKTFLDSLLVLENMTYILREVEIWEIKLTQYPEKDQ